MQKKYKHVHSGFAHEVNRPKRKKNVERYTPRSVFDILGMTFHCDPCAPQRPEARVVPATKFLTKDDDGLKGMPTAAQMKDYSLIPGGASEVSAWGRRWDDPAFLNHPYGLNDLHWASAFVYHACGIALTFSRTDTRFFHYMIEHVDGFSLTKGRIPFLRWFRGKLVPMNQPGAGSVFFAIGPQSLDALAQAAGKGDDSFEFGPVHLVVR